MSQGFRSSPTKAGHVVVFVAAKAKTEAMRRRVDPRMHHKPLTMHELNSCSGGCLLANAFGVSAAID
jgi:hypothetical protein